MDGIRMHTYYRSGQQHPGDGSDYGNVTDGLQMIVLFDYGWGGRYSDGV